MSTVYFLSQYIYGLVQTVDGLENSKLCFLSQVSFGTFTLNYTQHGAVLSGSRVCVTLQEIFSSLCCTDQSRTCCCSRADRSLCLAAHWFVFLKNDNHSGNKLRVNLHPGLEVKTIKKKVTTITLF